jgi:hypothetical protein
MTLMFLLKSTEALFSRQQAITRSRQVGGARAKAKPGLACVLLASIAAGWSPSNARSARVDVAVALHVLRPYWLPWHLDFQEPRFFYYHHDDRYVQRGGRDVVRRLLRPPCGAVLITANSRRARCYAAGCG